MMIASFGASISGDFVESALRETVLSRIRRILSKQRSEIHSVLPNSLRFLAGSRESFLPRIPREDRRCGLPMYLLGGVEMNFCLMFRPLSGASNQKYHLSFDRLDVLHRLRFWSVFVAPDI
jgi:hypothetical protein